jgi:hypothetical protein
MATGDRAVPFFDDPGMLAPPRTVRTTRPDGSIVLR